MYNLIFKVIEPLRDVDQILALLVSLAVIGLGIAYWQYNRRLHEYMEALKEGDKEGTNDHRWFLADLVNPECRKFPYLTRLENGLDYVSRLLGPLSHSNPTINSRLVLLIPRNPWTAQSYQFSLKFALIYPVLGLFFVWIVTGQDTSGISELLAENAGIVWRLGIASFFVLSLMAWLNYASAFHPKSTQYRKHRLRNFSLGVIAVIFSMFLFSDLDSYSHIFSFSVVSAFALSLALSGTFATVVAMSTSLTIGLISLGIVEVVVVAVLMLMVCMATVSLKYWADQDDWIERYYTFHWLGSIGFVLLMAYFSTVFAEIVFSFSWALIVFLVVLPLINALFDWLSIGITRGLLTQTLEERGRYAWRRSLLDLLLALLLLALLAITITSSLQVLNLLSLWGGGDQIYDVAGLLKRLRNTPSDPSVWWIYFMLFSTLLPTFLHGVIGATSFMILTIPEAKRKRYAVSIRAGLGRLERGEIARAFALRRVAAIYLTFVASLILVGVLYYGFPELARSLLFLCEWVAKFLGASLIPGPVL